jgi:hypothetical protein
MAVKSISSLTYQQSQAARAALTLSQKNVIDQTGIQAYKIKQFEAGRYRLDVIDQKKLRDFYETQGADFDEIDEGLKAKQQSEKADSNMQRGITPSAGAGFLISSEVSQDQVDSVLDRMEENDNRIAELIGSAYQTGFLGAVSDDSDAAMRELFGILAESHLLFRFLQGKNVIEPAKKEPKTIGDMLSQWFKGSPAYGVLGFSDGDAAPKAKAKPKAKAEATADESEG